MAAIEEHLQRVDERAVVSRWVRIFQILSLDRALPLFSELGLNAAHADAWRTVARTALEQFSQQATAAQARARRAMDAAQAPIWVWQEWEPGQGYAWVRAALAVAGEAAGIEAAQGLYAWGTGTFLWLDNERDKDHAYAWGQLLGSVGNQPPIAIDLASAQIRLLQSTAAQLLHPSTSELEDHLSPIEASAWDAALYQRFWADMDDEDQLTDVLTAAFNTIEYRRLRDMWAILRRTFTPGDFQSLLVWAKRRAPQLGVDPDSVALPNW